MENGLLGLPGFVGLLLAWGGLYALARWRVRARNLPADWPRDILAVGTLLLATIAFFWPLFFTESWIPKGGGDLSSFIYPMYVYSARWLKRGVIPLWNPHLYLGMPFAADNQSGLFYPINLLFFLLTPTLSYAVVELMAVSHVFLAGLFSYFLLRDLPSAQSWTPPSERPAGRHTLSGEPTMGRVPALLGAIAYMFSDLFVIHPGNLNIIATAAWLPLLLLCFRRAIVRQSWVWAIWSGIVLGVSALVGHAQMFLYLGASLALYLLFELYVGRRRGWRVARMHLLQFLLTGVLAFGLAALALIPGYDMTRYTVRSSLSYADASAFSIPPAGLISILFPGFFGRGTGPFWGPWLRTEMGYAGIFPLILAIIAAATTFRRRPLTRFWLLLGGFGLLTALGAQTVLHGWTYALVPFFRQVRVPARAIFLFDFSVAMLGATGLDVLMHPLCLPQRRTIARLYRRFAWIGGTIALVGLPLLGHAILVSRTAPEDILSENIASMGSVVFFLILFGAGLGWLSLRRRRLAGRTTLGVLAVLLVAFDLISLGAYVEIEPNDPLTGYRHQKALSFLRVDPQVFRVETAAEVQEGWAPDWALVEGMDDYSGIWNPLRLGAYDVLTWVGIGRDSRVYDLYNVKYLITRRDASVPGHFEPAYDPGGGSGWIIYRNPRALPRAFMAYRVTVVRGQLKALSTIRSPDFDPATQIALERGPGVQPLDANPGEAESRVDIVSRGPNHIDFQVIAPAEGYLFVSEMWLPGWVAYVDGARQDVLRADYTFRAVHIPPGSHAVRMVYRPRLWFLGLAVTLVTLAFLATWGVRWGVRSRRARHT